MAVLNGFNPTIASLENSDYLQQKRPMMKKFSKDFSDELMDSGDTILIPNSPYFSTVDDTHDEGAYGTGLDATRQAANAYPRPFVRSQAHDAANIELKLTRYTGATVGWRRDRVNIARGGFQRVARVATPGAIDAILRVTYEDGFKELTAREWAEGRSSSAVGTEDEDNDKTNSYEVSRASDGTYDVDVVGDLESLASNRHIDTEECVQILDAEAFKELYSDTNLRYANQGGSDAALRDALIGKVLSFDTVKFPALSTNPTIKDALALASGVKVYKDGDYGQTQIANGSWISQTASGTASAALTCHGFVIHPDALYFANKPLETIDDGLINGGYDLMAVDPNTGYNMNMSYWFERTENEYKMQPSTYFGWKIANPQFPFIGIYWA